MLPAKTNLGDFSLRLNNKREVRTRIIVTKKIAPKAVDRNRIKRLFLEALRALNFKEGGLVIFLNKNIADAKMQKIKEMLTKGLRKVKINDQSY